MYNVFCFRNSTLLIHFFLPLSPWIGSLIWVMLVLIAISDWHLLQKKKAKHNVSCAFYSQTGRDQVGNLVRTRFEPDRKGPGRQLRQNVSSQTGRDQVGAP